LNGLSEYLTSPQDGSHNRLTLEITLTAGILKVVDYYVTLTSYITPISIDRRCATLPSLFWIDEQ